MQWPGVVLGTWQLPFGCWHCEPGPSRDWALGVCEGGGGNGEGAGAAAMKKQKYFAFTNPQ